MEKHKFINHQLSVVRSFLEKYIGNLEYLPRWLVFSIDVSILLLANFISFVLISNLTLSFYDTLPIPVRYGIIVLVNISFFLLFKTYSGIIRHSSFLDGVKLFFFNKLCFCTFGICKLFFLFCYRKKDLPDSGVIRELCN